ncbi:MAG: monovalent cation/H(+) antiporter subunit G [Thermoplasmatales archaeon]|nr:monovalent cation/H(+) antiporter subunit G [Thermoplasmatales archaeon]
MIWEIIYVFLAIGIIFNLLASIGLIRFPDVYTRLHAGTKCTTFGSIFICLASIVYGLWKWYIGYASMIIISIHSFFALIAILLTNPTGAHAIARAAHKSGVKPKKAIVDDLEGKNEHV